MHDGQGSITETEHGFWSRAPHADNRRSLGTYPTRDQAEDVLRVYHEEKASGAAPGNSFAKFGEWVLRERRADGVRGIKEEEDRFRLHLRDSALGKRPVAAIEPIEIDDFVRALGRKQAQDRREKRKISRATVKNCLTLVSVIMSRAVTRNVRPSNPCVGIKVRDDAEATEEKWDWLRVEEQEAFATCSKIPEWARLLVEFAWNTGLRQGEQWCLELRDLHVDGPEPHVFVRFGSPGKLPKSGRTRKVPLLPRALAAAKRWLEILPTYAPKNPLGLVFPSPMGCRRPKGAPSKSVRTPEGKIGKVECLTEWLRAAGVARDIRWHDLRHTCASSLVTGSWGRVWTLEEVRDMLGHSSVTVTERYAHLGETTLKKAAAATPQAGYQRVSEDVCGPLAAAIFPSDINESRLRGLNSRPTVYEGEADSKDFNVLSGSSNPPLTHIAERILELVSRGRVAEAIAAAVTLASTVLDEAPPASRARIA